MTVLGDELAKKLAEKANDINSFVWKGPRDSQDRIKGGRNNFPKEERWSH